MEGRVLEPGQLLNLDALEPTIAVRINSDGLQRVLSGLKRLQRFIPGLPCLGDLAPDSLLQLCAALIDGVPVRY